MGARRFLNVESVTHRKDLAVLIDDRDRGDRRIERLGRAIDDPLKSGRAACSAGIANRALLADCVRRRGWGCHGVGHFGPLA